MLNRFTRFASPSWTEVADPLVLPIIVNVEDIDDIEALENVASAVPAFLYQVEVDSVTEALLQEWVKQPIRKVVRRAKGNKWRQFASQADFVAGNVGILPPYRASAVPDAIRRFQVAGTNLPRSRSVTVAPVRVCVLDSLSTGKAAAQVGHAVQMLATSADVESLESWKQSGFAVRVDRVDSIVSSESNVVIVDAGFTEIPPGTVTASAVFE